MNMNIKTSTTVIAIAFTVMTVAMGLAAADTDRMDYMVDFEGYGTGSVSIFTLTPVGIDFQNVNWANCETTGVQDGHYNDGWMKIDRSF